MAGNDFVGSDVGVGVPAIADIAGIAAPVFVFAIDGVIAASTFSSCGDFLIETPVCSTFPDWR